MRASHAARDALAARIEALGAITLRDAAAARGIDPHTAYEWARRGLSTSAFRGPRKTWVTRQQDFDVETAGLRCRHTGCAEYALLSKSGYCKRHDACVPRGDDQLTASEFAEKYGLDAPALVTRLTAGEIPGQCIGRGGRPLGWLVPEHQALAVLNDRFRCQWTDGCDRYAVGASGHCSDHAGAATARVNARGLVAKVCEGCGAERKAYPSQQREGSLCHACNLASDEFDEKRRDAVRKTWEARHEVIEQAGRLVQLQRVAADIGVARHALSAPGSPTRSVRGARWRVLGVEFVLLDGEAARAARRAQLVTGDGRLKSWTRPKQVRRRLGSVSPDAERRLERRQGVAGRVAAEVAAESGTRVGRRCKLSPRQEARIRELAARGLSQRSIARMLGVSRDQVQRLLAADKVVRNPP